MLNKQTNKQKSRHCEIRVIGSNNNLPPKQSHAHSDEIASMDDFIQRPQSLSRNDARAFIENQKHSRRLEFICLLSPLSFWRNVRNGLTAHYSLPCFRKQLSIVSGTHGRRHLAFTLAEVLITLGIIGIVAAMTIPTLMNRTNNSEYETAFKKALSNITNVENLVKNDNGGNLVGVYANDDAALDGLCNYFKCVKKCPESGSDKSCFHSTDWYMLDGRAGWGDFSALSSAVLADGSTMTLLWIPNCDVFRGMERCGHLTIDTNGFKKPNRMGRDMFEIFMLSNKVVPNGTQGTSQDYATHASNCDPTSTAGDYNGAACGGRILQEGGMKY
jgi:prepilin-type N-terminal cleavage/methylation domain-containing protein